MEEMPPLSGRRTREVLQLHFNEGTADEGRMTARSAAATLKAADDLVKALARQGEYANHKSPVLHLQAVPEGSIELALVLEAIGEFWASTRDVLTSDDAQAIATLVEFIGLFGGVVAYLVRKGREDVVSEKVNDDGQVETQLSNGETLVEPPEVVEAASSPRVQSAARDFVAAGTNNGIQMTISAETVNMTTVVRPGDAERIPDPSESEPEVEPRSYEATATFERPDFGGDVWKVRTTRDVHMMRIEDEEFLRLIDSGAVTLGKYSEFKVFVVEEPRVTASGQIRYDRRVTKVEAIEERPRQHELFHEPEDGSD